MNEVYLAIGINHLMLSVSTCPKVALFFKHNFVFNYHQAVQLIKVIIIKNVKALILFKIYTFLLNVKN
jgi:hypothetical protein